MNRFDYHADTSDEATQYLKYRVKEFLRFGARLIHHHTFESGDVAVVVELNGENFLIIYVLSSNRGQGAYPVLYAEAQKELSSFSPRRVLTVWACNVDDYLNDKGISYLMLDPHRMSGDPEQQGKMAIFSEYTLIDLYWANKVAKRTGVPYMLHVDEGLGVLEEIGASERAMRIYALHGLLQEVYRDKTYDFPGLSHVSPDVLIGAMEYRAVANAHLSSHDPCTPKLSEDPDVNEALIADKVQNRKDFELYHRDTHDRSDALDAYFRRWLKALGITETRYAELAAIISNGD